MNYSQWEPEELKRSLRRLSPENMVVFQQSNEFRNIVNREEKWYGGRYHVENLNLDFIDELSDTHPKPYFSLPGKIKRNIESENKKSNKIVLFININYVN